MTARDVSAKGFIRLLCNKTYLGVGIEVRIHVDAHVRDLEDHARGDLGAVFQGQRLFDVARESS
jgi:hypothetical protein